MTAAGSIFRILWYSEKRQGKLCGSKDRRAFAGYCGCSAGTGLISAGQTSTHTGNAPPRLAFTYFTAVSAYVVVTRSS